MKKIMKIFGTIFFISSMLISCGGAESTNAVITKTEASIDVCRCLTEPGNSDWAISNKDACRDAISKEIGVDNWEEVNFSQNPDLNRKFDALTKRCTGSTEVKTGVEEIDKNNLLVKEIGTSYGYIWESLNIDAQLYTTLSFDGLKFRTIAYAMNGQTNSDDFSKIIELSGDWSAIDEKNAEGIYRENNVTVSWYFNDDYTSLTNNKGVVFTRVRVK